MPSHPNRLAMEAVFKLLTVTVVSGPLDDRSVKKFPVKSKSSLKRLTRGRND